MKGAVHLYVHDFQTAYGKFRVWATGRGLYAVEFGCPLRPLSHPAPPAGIRNLLGRAKREILSYLTGRRPHFERLPIDWSGSAGFERKVLKHLRRIPWGKTACYQDLAVRAGRSRAARAVGRILHENRLPLVLPCHRILAKNGGWGGFSQGLTWKKRLLKLENPDVDIKVSKKPLL